ncbi:MAG: polyisoprenoid-binding protein [Rhodocyclaceae bacterium]|jgi:polyisoprenoid-binding protein YceI|nr:polyisoprenoid-binding protein [Rhodocyclaceae bacterium]MCP5296388.1 polyisoprenoid-binding protein [Zoogloeaceae bacterium]PKO71379.1 MAG: polyisoprenoid-binding protein [Betaproteobacteria bacterium HGW-Betaproteobacteria-14]
MKLKALTAVLATLTFAPAFAQTYNVEPNHTYPSFEAGHLGISVWRGKFAKTSGSVTLDRAGKSGTVDIVIDASSIDFGHAKMEEHARKGDFFNVEFFPKITYKGKITKWNGDAPAAVEGEMTLLDVTKPLNLTINSFKCITHPLFKKEVCGADASGGFKRSDFGMKYGLPLHGDDVKVAIQIEAIRAD